MINKNLYIKDKYSRKHHYLPVFYLKGFTDKNNRLCVYDKVQDKILTKQKPESKFFENDLNNFKYKGEIKLTIEEPVFNPLDTNGAILFKRIRGDEFLTQDNLTALEKFDFLHFIARLFWRLPFTNDIFNEIIKKEGITNKYFGFKKKGSNEFFKDEDIQDIKNQILNDNETRKLFKPLIPLSDGTYEEMYRLYDKWKLFSFKVLTPNLIIGDAPFLINNDDIRLNNIFNELIFPISKYRLLTLSGKTPDFLDEILMTNINLAILYQSKRLIASDSEENIRNVLKHYNTLVQKNLEKDIIKNTFRVMYYQAQFNNYEEYLAKYEIEKEKYNQRNM